MRGEGYIGKGGLGLQRPRGASPQGPAGGRGEGGGREREGRGRVAPQRSARRHGSPGRGAGPSPPSRRARPRRDSCASPQAGGLRRGPGGGGPAPPDTPPPCAAGRPGLPRFSSSALPPSTRAPLTCLGDSRLPPPGLRPWSSTGNATATPPAKRRGGSQLRPPAIAMSGGRAGALAGGPGSRCGAPGVAGAPCLGGAARLRGFSGSARRSPSRRDGAELDTEEEDGGGGVGGGRRGPARITPPPRSAAAGRHLPLPTRGPEGLGRPRIVRCCPHLRCWAISVAAGT